MKVIDMLPIRNDDGSFINALLEKNESFRRLMEERWQQASGDDVSSLEEVRRRLSSPASHP